MKKQEYDYCYEPPPRRAWLLGDIVATVLAAALLVGCGIALYFFLFSVNIVLAS
jgi:hypothetical protein